VIKVIKRNATPELPATVSKQLQPTRTVTATVNDWIAERRQVRLDEDNSSRDTIAGWGGQAGN
jgi:hypothetical protein